MELLEKPFMTIRFGCRKDGWYLKDMSMNKKNLNTFFEWFPESLDIFSTHLKPNPSNHPAK